MISTTKNFIKKLQEYNQNRRLNYFSKNWYYCYVLGFFKVVTDTSLPSDGFSNFMLDFTIAMNKYARVAIVDFTNKIDKRSHAHKRRLETMKGKSQIAIDMVTRAVNSGIYADYLLVDSWYSKPVFIKEMNELGLKVISRRKCLGLGAKVKIIIIKGKEK